MKTLLSLTIFVLSTGPVSAELYKWVDEQGKVHYSDQPGSGKIKSETKLEIANQPAKAGPDTTKTWQEKDLDYKKRVADAAEAETKKQQAAQDAKTKLENCDKAKQNLSQLESNLPVATFSEQTGRTILNEAQRADATQKARKSVSEWCK